MAARPATDETMDEDSTLFLQPEDEPPVSFSQNTLSPQRLSLITVLQHFAVYTHQKQSHMTYFLKLLKTHQPLPYYDELPNSGRELLKIEDQDWCSPKGGSDLVSKGIPVAKKVNEGKYIHFGLEQALLGNSHGIVHRDSDLLQYVEVYRNHPLLLPIPLRNKVTNICFKILT